MSIHLANEKLIPLSAVPRIPRMRPGRGGKRLHLATVYRWAQHGIRGIRLETIVAGGVRCTSILALQRFFEQLTAAYTAASIDTQGHTMGPTGDVTAIMNDNLTQTGGRP